MSFSITTLDILHFCKDVVIFLQDTPPARYALIAVSFLLVGILFFRMIAPKTDVTDDTFTARDFNRIAGEDIPSTQLDLAKAYIEMDQKKQAKSILKKVIKQAKGQLKQDAKLLMKTL